MRTLYDVLGVSQEATYREIRDAYHCRVNALYPPPCEHLEGDERTAAAGELRWIRRAWDILSSPECRRHYDRQLVEMFIRATGELARAVSADLLLQVGNVPGFSCRNCGHEVKEATPIACPICGAPAKAVWVPKSRILRRSGLAPALIRMANFSAHQYRSVAGTLTLLRTVLRSLANPLLLLVFVLVLALFYLAWLGSQTEEGWPGAAPTPFEFTR